MTSTNGEDMVHNGSSAGFVGERKGLVPWAPRRALLLVAAPLALLVVAAGTLVSIRGVENHLGAETRSDLATLAAGTETLDIDFEYRDGTISGVLPSGVSVDDIRQAVSVDGIRSLDVSGLVEGQPDTAPQPDTAAVDTPPNDTQATDTPEADPPVTDALAADTAPTDTAPIATDVAVTEPPVVDDSVPPPTDPVTESTSSPAVDPAESEAIALQAELDEIGDLLREDVVFSASSDDLDAQAEEALDSVVALLEQYPLPVVQITGHTDDRGSEDTNSKLSGSRAEAVAAYLVSEGISSSRVRSDGAGESEPIADNSTSEGQAENRRVQFTALGAFA